MFSSLSESGFIPTIHPRHHEWVDRTAGSHLFQRVASFLQRSQLRNEIGGSRHSSHLFQRVASFLQGSTLVTIPVTGSLFSSLSESGFIPTGKRMENRFEILTLFSSLSESGFIPTHSGPSRGRFRQAWFSSLSESGFIPTFVMYNGQFLAIDLVLISFREWLHSYAQK